MRTAIKSSKIFESKLKPFRASPTRCYSWNNLFPFFFSLEIALKIIILYLILIIKIFRREYRHRFSRDIVWRTKVEKSSLKLMSKIEILIDTKNSVWKFDKKKKKQNGEF